MMDEPQEVTTEQQEARYVAVVGLDFPGGKRYEPGDDVPKRSVSKHRWLLKSGKVKKVEG